MDVIKNMSGPYILSTDMFPERAEAQGSLCPVRPLGLLPGVCSRGVGGFFCRKNAAFLNRTLKNCGVLPLGLVAGGAWASRSYAYLRCFRSLCLAGVTYWRADLMHIYGASAHFV